MSGIGQASAIEFVGSTGLDSLFNNFPISTTVNVHKR